MGCTIRLKKRDLLYLTAECDYRARRRAGKRVECDRMETKSSPASQELADLAKICDRLRELGYAQSKRIRIYGQEFEVISNPFPQGKGVAVQAQPKGAKQARVLQLPLPSLQMVTRRKPA